MPNLGQELTLLADLRRVGFISYELYDKALQLILNQQPGNGPPEIAGTRYEAYQDDLLQLDRQWARDSERYKVPLIGTWKRQLPHGLTSRWIYPASIGIGLPAYIMTVMLMLSNPPTLSPDLIAFLLILGLMLFANVYAIYAHICSLRYQQAVEDYRQRRSQITLDYWKLATAEYHSQTQPVDQTATPKIATLDSRYIEGIQQIKH
jgi:hypothetical protein